MKRLSTAFLETSRGFHSQNFLHLNACPTPKDLNKHFVCSVREIYEINFSDTTHKMLKIHVKWSSDENVKAMLMS